MNAARRAIIADLRMQGLTGKEAYEASKRPEFMREWLRVQLSSRHLFEKKPKIYEPGWISNYVAMRQLKALQKESVKAQDQVLGNKRKVFIAKSVKAGHSVESAIEFWEKEQAEEKKKAKDDAPKG